MLVDAVDIVVLTVLPPELAAARKAFSVGARRKAPGGTVYYRGALASRLANRDYSIAVICIGSPGNPTAAAMATAAASMFRPKALFLSGIGGGFRKKTKIGDAVFFERVVAYESAAAVGSKWSSRLEPRHDTERLPHSIVQDLVSWMADDEREGRMRAHFAKLGAKPRAKRGQAAEFRTCVADPGNTRLETAASGEKLVKNARVFFELQKLHGKIKVVEMEAVGIIEACRQVGVPWLVVRGISDFGDRFKDDRFHDYASLTAAIALADFIACGLQLDPDPPRVDRPGVDVEPYLAAVRADLERTTETAVARTALTLAKTPVHLSGTGGLVPSDGEVYFLSGPSGRGKTTALRLVAAAASAANPVRYPVFVQIDEDSSFTELLRRGMNLGSAIDDDAIRSWFAHTPTIVIADDWHRRSQAAREHFEALIAGVPRSRCAILVAGVESVSPPRVLDMRYLRLPRWSPEERDQLIDAAMMAAGAPPHPPRGPGLTWTEGGLSPQLQELLCEPVLLAKFLEMVQRSTNGITRALHDLPELFGRLLVALLTSVHADAPRRAREVTAVCGRLVQGGDRITLPRIAAALTACGVVGEAGHFANDLCAAALWKWSGGIYDFEHEMWRIYFLATMLQTERAWSAPGPLTTWVGDMPYPELAQLLPFAMAMLRDPVLQPALFDALRSRDPELYFRSLRTGAPPKALQSMPERERARYVLTELHAGYLGLVDRYVPALRSLLLPWSQGDGGEQARGEKPVISGTLTDDVLQYYVGFGPVDGPDMLVEDLGRGPAWRDRLSYAPERGYQVNSMRADDLLSARLIGARLLMDQLKELCKKGNLPPCGWIGRERLRSAIQKLGFSGHLGEGYEHRSVVWIRNLLRSWLDRAGTADICIEIGWDEEIGASELHELAGIADQLVDGGLGDMPMWDLGLPGPDLPARGGWPSHAYSDTRKHERIAALYKAVTETYCSLYEQYFTGFNGHAFYAQFPMRAIVRIGPDLPFGSARVRLRWQMVTHGAAMDPEVSTDLVAGERSDALADQMRADCERFKRPFIRFTTSGRSTVWKPWDPVVTNEVTQMVSSDLEGIAGWLAGSS